MGGYGRATAQERMSNPKCLQVSKHQETERELGKERDASLHLSSDLSPAHTGCVRGKGGEDMAPSPDSSYYPERGLQGFHGHLLYHWRGRMPAKSNFKEQGFILAHSQPVTCTPSQKAELRRKLAFRSLSPVYPAPHCRTLPCLEGTLLPQLTQDRKITGRHSWSLVS